MDQRDRRLIEHELRTLVGQRVLGIALGYEDLIDHDTLRHDPDGGAGRQVAGEAAELRAGGRQVDVEPAGAEQCAAGAVSQDRLSAGGGRGAVRAAVPGGAPGATAQIVLDLDATDDPLHGHQEGRFFHGYYDGYCYLPLYIFCGRHLLAAKLRRANIDASAGAVEEVARIVSKVRRRWPHVRILLRADSERSVSERDQAMHWIQHQLVQEVTAATADPALVQHSLSERLANRGILPMFGFPTRARYLYHRHPGRWPPSDVVDRDLELAISQFAPGAETVKERTIHTAIGVVRYLPQGNRCVEDPDPLGPAYEIGLCGNCQHVETENPNAGSCVVCGMPAGTGDNEYRTIDLRQPKGFQSYYTKARDYDGSFDFVPRAARPKVGRPPFALGRHRNFDIGAGQSRVYVINDNGGRLFDLAPAFQNSDAMVDIDAASAADAKFAATQQGRPRQFNLVHLRQPVSCALAAISETDLLLLGVGSYGQGFAADPRVPEGRAALYSLAFMLRRAAAVLLDIQDYELKAGIRSHNDPSVGVVGQIFLSDTLENGAGYATHLGQPAVAEELLRMVTEPGPREFHERLSAPLHADACYTSCPDCLRSYSNLAYHSLLDWRLAVDMARLALDSSVPITLSSPLWLQVANTAALTLASARPGFQQTAFAGIPGIANEREAIILTHPLWVSDRTGLAPELQSACDEAEQTHGLQIDRFISVFEALRRPI